jgi:hypothetical protein
MSDDASLLLLGVTSLLPGAGQSSATLLPVAYWVVTLHIPLVVYLKMSFGSRKGGGCCVPHTLLPSAFALAPWGNGSAPSGCCARPGMGLTHGVWVACACPLGESDGELGV